MNEPQRVPLERLLAEEAERAIPGDIDLWANVSRQLHERGQSAITPHLGTTEPDWRRLSPTRALPAFGGWRRPGELVGNAVSFGLGALAIVMVALVVGLTGRGAGSPGIGAGTPDPAMPPVSSPGPVATSTPGAASDHEFATFVECTFDLDIAPRAEAGRVVIPVEVRTTGRCDEGRVLQLAIVDANGRRPDIAGNSFSIPLEANVQERRAAVEVEWQNWCGEPGRFRIESRFGSERHTLPLPEPPSCINQDRPSTLRLVASNPAFTPPATPIP